MGSTWGELLEGPSPEEVARAVEVLHRRRHETSDAPAAMEAYSAAQDDGEHEGAAGEGRGPAVEQPPAPCSSGRGSSADSSSSTGSGRVASGHRGGGVGGPLDIVAHEDWAARLAHFLASNPNALVGEVGVDRSAVIPGTKARVRFDHQMALLREQLAIAAAYGRPVSVHCVLGYGHLLQLFAGLAPGTCPRAVMLHSYGGSPEEVPRFTRLPGIGQRFYFSFSAAINGRTPEKLAARIRAVPDDRLLLESDQVGSVARAGTLTWEATPAHAGGHHVGASWLVLSAAAHQVQPALTLGSCVLRPR